MQQTWAYGSCKARSQSEKPKGAREVLSRDKINVIARPTFALNWIQSMDSDRSIVEGRFHSRLLGKLSGVRFQLKERSHWVIVPFPLVVSRAEPWDFQSLLFSMMITISSVVWCNRACKSVFLSANWFSRNADLMMRTRRRDNEW